MCGIVGCIGVGNVREVLLDGLQQLEYRGYDSAGVAVYQDERINVTKCSGKVSDLAEKLEPSITSQIGIGHTRWATHGEPSEQNAHPHQSNSGRFVLVHNGIIENYADLKHMLEQNGYQFASETDTEVLVNLIDFMAREHHETQDIVRAALLKVAGAYAIALIDALNAESLVVARKGSPLVIGIGDGGYYIASDASPLVAHTDSVIYLEDGELAVLRAHQEPQIISIEDAKHKDPVSSTIETDRLQIEKGGYEHFMLKEIYEQPEAVLNSIRGRVRPAQGIIKLGGIEEYEQQIARANRLIIVACGTSWHAGLVAEYYFEQLAKLPVEVEYASEFRYRDPVIMPGDVVIAISQSGETADTLAALELAKEKGALILGICNVAGSSIARLTDGGIYTHAGPEVSVASTKAFSTQVSVLLAFAVRIAELRAEVGPSRLRTLSQELYAVPEKITQVLEHNESIKSAAEAFSETRDVLYLGRGLAFPVALEGALKLKEISYIHAEGYPAGEMKHGPIALIEHGVPVVVVAPYDRHFQKMLSNVQEIKARGGSIIAVTNPEGERYFDDKDICWVVPKADETVAPLLANIPLQLLSYHVANRKGLNVDRPRNLAKSVTVE